MRRAVVIALLLLWACGQAVASREYSVGAAPDWVLPIEPDLQAEPPAGNTGDNRHYLLSDRQVRADRHDTHAYAHFATRALDISGVEAIANIDLAFNPAHQTMTLHTIRVIRDGAAIDKLATAEIRVLQREPDLERLIYDGRKTAHVFLDDVRTGDIVEYAYSVRGRNPVFGERHFGGLDLGWSVPVRHAYARLVLPDARDFTLTTRNTGLQPTQWRRGDSREYLWQQFDVPALSVDDDSPDWYQPYPEAQWSTYPDWPSVARWAAPLYAVPAPVDSIREVVAGIAAEAEGDEARLLAALRFVQSQIRYLGVEVGVGSHRPSPPEQVLRRRFGDCKDKTLLLLALLEGLGIEAHAALVDTVGTRSLRERLPTPGSFDHVLVRARLGGVDYWLDPTFNPQQGTLATLHQPNHAYALIVDPRAGDLVTMDSPRRAQPRRSIHVLIDSRAGFETPASYTVTTTTEHGSADRQRRILGTRDHRELEQAYLDFYASRYPGIELAAPLEIDDDTSRNRIKVTERYRIESLWQAADEPGQREANVSAADIRNALPADGGSATRNAPLAVPYPYELRQVTEVLLPGPWTIKPETTTVDNEVFRFRREIENSGNRLVFTDSFVMKSDHVTPAQLARYRADLKRVRSDLNYYLWYTDTPARAWYERINWMIGLIGAMVLGTCIALALRLYRWDPQPGPGPIQPGLQGIGGWLILPAIGVVSTPLLLIANLGGALELYELSRWEQLTRFGSSEYHPLWAPALLFSLTANLARLVFSTLLAVLFFQKRGSTPIIYCALLLAGVIVHCLELLLVAGASGSDISGKDTGELIGLLVSSAIWYAYFSSSRRVRSTFVRTRAERASWQNARSATPDRVPAEQA